MKKKLLCPEQIITLQDYPVHNEQILKIYFRIFQKGQGKILPACPVIHKSVGTPYIAGRDFKSKQYNLLLEKYLNENPNAEYFLIDGGHKTAAATLANRKIPVLVIEKDKDFRICQKLVEKGELFGWYKVEKSIKDAITELAKHHFGTKKFMTVEDKVKKMVRNKDVPRYIITFYKKRSSLT
jgi:hypothetical protein